MKAGQTTRLLLVALAAGALGVAVGLWREGPSPLLHTELGQRALQQVASASAPQPPADLKIAERGQIVPAFSLPSLAGQPVAVPQAYAGRPVLVNLWASWCGPCIKEMPELDRYARAQGPNGTQVVGIALDEAAAVQAFLQRIPVGYAVLIDTPGPRDAGVRLGNPKGVLPYTVLLDAHGRVLKQKLGPFRDGEIDAWAR
ncbi:TlpA family protein disulfide reductase [Lysobacter solisilvae (ex Woo and Kim 2020)]|uniref:TlpA family protein disulfide reductase n=1 Tax=Agrilutibacter terrestris TaxID=2865112 RepID=A0A7H0FZV7_9GAMM|nr:TlpA disulfide reductase family protein [Lysobacter terrestris]QNP41573.1 TlpA family protein disulfide reductase [Lysobacter terrestris]